MQRPGNICLPDLKRLVAGSDGPPFGAEVAKYVTWDHCDTAAGRKAGLEGLREYMV